MRLLAAAIAAAAAAPSAAWAGEPGGVAPPTRAGGATTARIVTGTRVRLRLADPDRARPIRPWTRWSRQDQVLLVLRSATHAGRTWVQVLLAERPTGATGWIPRDDVQLRRTRWWIEVRIASREVVVFHDGRRSAAYRAVVGAAATPTPNGLAAVYERNRQPDPDGFLGPWALALTAVSGVLEDFGGGPGRVAIHGRGGTSLLESAWERTLARLHPDLQRRDPQPGPNHPCGYPRPPHAE